MSLGVAAFVPTAPRPETEADDTAKEFAANVVAGIAVIPSGVWGANRAQEAGCTCCAGG